MSTGESSRPDDRSRRLRVAVEPDALAISTATVWAKAARECGGAERGVMSAVTPRASCVRRRSPYR